jgi:hypothetical protein
METKTTTTLDRAALGWPPGPWDAEPDKAQWTDHDSGLPCLAVRDADEGFWCGYVGVPPGNPWHGVSNDLDDFDFEVHGGVYFAGSYDPEHEDAKNLTRTGPDGQLLEDAGLWWFGFACDNSYDTFPGYVKPAWALGGGVYRTLGYVQRQCALLAEELDQDMEIAP